MTSGAGKDPAPEFFSDYGNRVSVNYADMVGSLHIPHAFFLNSRSFQIT
jgi:hypothetical protein